MKLKIFFLLIIAASWVGHCSALSHNPPINNYNTNFIDESPADSLMFWPYQAAFFYFHKDLIDKDYNKNQARFSLPPNTYNLLTSKNQLIDAPTLYDINRILDDFSLSMNSTEKIELVTSLGQSFRKNYDNSRAHFESGSGDIVSLEDLLAGLRDSQPAGVCRDIAVGQAQILDHLGSHNTYVLRFQTFGSGHATVVTQIFDNPSTLYKINYDELTIDTHNLGIDKLHQNTTIPDIGIHYHFYNIDGKPVARLTSGLGQVLNDASGGSEKEFDPFIHSWPNLMRLNITKGFTSGRIFCGITKNKEEIVGLAMNKKMSNKNDTLSLQLQSAASQYQSERNYVTLRANLIYTRIYGKLETPQLQIGNFFIQGGAGLDGTALIGQGTIDYKGITDYNDNELIKKDNVEDYGISALGHIESLWISENRKTSIKTNLYTNFYGDFYAYDNDIRRQKENFNGISPVHNYTLFHCESGYEIASKTKCIFKIAHVYRKVGTLNEIELGIQKKQLGFTIGQTFPSPTLPNWVENSRKRIYAEFQKRINKNSGLIFWIENIEDGPQDSLLNSWFSISLLLR